jgi:hypothetical protein
VIIAEIGADMAPFSTPAHLASWAGMCPGNNEPAGKHFSGLARKGDRWLRAALGEAAAAAAGTRDFLQPREPVGRYIRVLTTQGERILDRSVLSQDAATLIGQHWNAVKAVINDTPGRYSIGDFEDVEISPGVFLLADEDFIYDLSAEGELDVEDIYEA